MNIDALRVFCEVAKQRSFSRAASCLDMTQPAASQAVQQLERELQQQLFDRSRRPPQLTPAGERFFSACREILDQLDRAVAEMREHETDIVGPINVASIYSVGLYHAGSFHRFMETFPRAAVRLQYLRPNLVVQAVLEGEATLGLLSYPVETRELAVIPWKEEEMVLVCPPSHPLASRPFVRLKDLDGLPLVGFDADLTIRKRIDAALHKQKVDARVVLEFDNIETLKQAIQIGSGVGILPAETVKLAVNVGTLAAVRIEPAELMRPVGIIYRKGKQLSAASLKFVETLTGRSFAASTLPLRPPEAVRA